MNISTYMATGAMGSSRRRGPGPSWGRRATRWDRIAFWFVVLAPLLLCVALTIWAFIATPDAQGDSTLLPTVPPALPTYIVKDDGTHIDCGPNYRWCWENRTAQ